MRPPHVERRRGSSLIFVLPILGLLALFLVALASLVRLEQNATANRLEGDRARLAAEAGLERALFLLGEDQLRSPLAGLHTGWAYRDQAGKTWGLDLPLELARQPSYKQAALLPGGPAHSGIVSATYGLDTFALKIVDCSSRLNLNAVDGELLDALGRAILEFDERRADASDPLHDAGWLAWRQEERLFPTDPIRGRGAELQALRESKAGSFTRLDQLLAVLTPDELDRLRPYVTLHSWRDPTHGLAAPVNVNTASWPVLVACIEGVANDDEALEPDMARALATALDAARSDPARGPFVSVSDLLPVWEEAGLPSRGVLRDLFVSNAHPSPFDFDKNPPSHIRQLGGDAPFQSLERTTTPFCFITHGRFEVRSLGRVTTPDGLELAAAELSAVVSVYDTARLATQEEFELARSNGDDRWQIESYPNPVAGLAGPMRYRMEGEDSTVFMPGTGPPLRWRVSHPESGYLGPGYAKLRVRFDPGRMTQVHAFRFNPDLKGDIVDASGLRAEHDRPNTQGTGAGGTPADQVYTYAGRAGVHPAQLGEIGAQNPNPTGAQDYTVLLEPDGLISSEERNADLRYPNDVPGLPVISGSMAIRMRFRMAEGRGGNGWAPLLEARVRPDATYAGLSPTGDTVDLQVEVAKGTGTSLRVRTRIVSSQAPAVAADPTLPVDLDLSLPAIEREYVFDTAPLSPVGGWHTLYMPVHLNAHTVLIDGQVLPVVGGDGNGDGVPDLPGPAEPWPLPAWTSMAVDQVVPAGVAEPRPDYPRVTIDDLVITQFSGDAGLQALRAAVLSGNDGGSTSHPDRFRRMRSDAMGSFVGELHPFAGTHPRVGVAVWTEVLPTHWNDLVYPPSDFMIQVVSGYRGEPERAQVSARPIPPPAPEHLAQPLVRFWRLRWLEAREAELSARVELYTRLAERSSDPPDPDAVLTYNAYAQAFTEALEAVSAEREGILRSHGEPDLPRDGSSVAFGPTLRLGPDEGALGFRIDFLYLGASAEQVASAVDTLLFPYQESVRVLAREWD